MRYSNEQSGPSEYYSALQYRHPTTCDTVGVYQFLAKKKIIYFLDFISIKVSVMKISEKAQYHMSDVLLCHLFFTA